jgi:hypothetical protein
MTYHQGLALVLIAAGLSPLPAGDPPPQPANPRDARILFRIDLPDIKVVVKEGRTLLYEVPRVDSPQSRAPELPADSPKGRPAPARPPMEKARPERKSDQVPAFGKVKVEKLIKLLQAGEGPAPLRPESIRESWLVSWPNPDWGMERGPDSVTVWAGAFDYEVVFAFRLSGPGRAPPRPRKGE